MGEAWLSSLGCKIEGSALPAGVQNLGELWQGLGAVERGATAAGLGRFPLLAKMLFTSDKLSVQVHPDDEFAREYEQEPWGKSEVWYVLEAEADAWVRVGLKQEFSGAELGGLLGAPGIEDALQEIPVRVGDVVSVSAGTLHSIGPGLVLCEIQQYSDVTYRVHDYDRPGLDRRPRPLHLAKARAAAKLKTPDAGLCPPAALPGSSGGQVLFTGPRFVLQRFESNTSLRLSPEPSHFDLIITLAGSGRIRAAGETIKFRGVETFLVTANAGEIEVVPDEPSQWLRTFPVGQWQ